MFGCKHIGSLVSIKFPLIPAYVKVSSCIIASNKNHIAVKCIMIDLFRELCARKKRIITTFYSLVCIKFTCTNITSITNSFNHGNSAPPSAF